MSSSVWTVLALAEIKAAILRFDNGEENATDTLTSILEACKAAQENAAIQRDAA